MLTRLKPYEGDYSKFGVFDIENITDSRGKARSAKDFKLGVCYVDGVYHDFTDKEAMHNFIMQKQFIGYRWYGHNVEYDLNGFYKNVLTIPDSTILMNGSRFIELKVKVGSKLSGHNKETGKQQVKNKYIRFWDTFNLIPLSLEKIGRVFNLPKLKFNTDDFTYCRRDCEITHLIIEKYHSYCERFFISPKLTTSSTAMSIFRTNFLKGNIWIDENDLYFKNSYIGGRTEVFKKVLVNGYHYDVNSLYPKAMCEDYYPNPKKIRKGNNKNFEYYLKNFEGVGHFKVKTPDKILIPILPYHFDGKIIYPEGVFNGWFNFNELRFAIERGYQVLEIFEYYYAERMDSPFKEYVSYWYEAKSSCKKSDPGFYDFCKRMMNGLYGKFGEYHDSGVWSHVSFDPRTKEEKEADIDIFSIYTFMETKEGYGTWIKKNETLKEQITDHTIFAWCSYVTSYARMILYRELEASGLENVAYVDTDSKFTTKEQKSSDELGLMKEEHRNIDCYFAAPKMYQIIPRIQCRDFIEYSIELSLNKPEYKLKGVKLDGRGIFAKSYTQNRVIKSKEALRRGLEAGAWMKVIKEPTGKDTKRIWLKNGDSLPIVINPLENNLK